MQFIVEKQQWKFKRLDDDKERLNSTSDGRYVVEIYNADPRTNAQNRYYRVMLEIIAQDTGHTKDELHAVFKNMFLNVNDQGIITTTQETVEQFSKYVENIKKRCAVNGYIVPDLN